MTKTELDYAFDLHLVDNRIFIDNTDVEPGNKDDIIGKLTAHRSKLEESGLTKEKFKRFRDLNKVAIGDATMMSTVLPMITGESDTTTANSLSFSELEDLTDGSLTKPVASCCDGFLPDQIDLRIRKDLGRYILPSNKTLAPFLPNFFIEGEGKDWEVAKRRGCYCGTLGARGIYKLRSFIDPDTALDNKAYTIVATYYKEDILKIYTIHPARFGDDKITYYMALLDGFIMNTNLDSFPKLSVRWEAHEIDDDNNLIVFPPKADDNSYTLIYSVPVHWKTRPECGTTLNMTPAHCF